MQRDQVKCVLEACRKYYEKYDREFSKFEGICRYAPTDAGIYAIRFPLDDGSEAVYIGQSVDLNRRLKEHLEALRFARLGPTPSLQVLGDLILENESEMFLGEALLQRGLADRASSRSYAYVCEVLSQHWPEVRWFIQRPRSEMKKHLGGPALQMLALRGFHDVKVDVLETFKHRDPIILNQAEARWHAEFRSKGNVFPLWRADTSRHLRDI